MKTTKTIPFDWELYNNNRDKYKVVTKSGKEVTQLTLFKRDSPFKLVGIIMNNIYTWTENGHYNGDEEDSYDDLQLQYEEEVVERWVNVYENEYGGRCVGRIYSLKEDTMREHARSFSTSKLIKTINLNDL